MQWYKNDVNIDNSPDYAITFNNGEAVLKFDEIFLEDKALYTCKATNRLGQSSTIASLDVQRKTDASFINNTLKRALLVVYVNIDFAAAQIVTKKPYFLVPLSNAMARTGQRVKLECEVDGNPMPELSWTYDDKPVEETKYHKVLAEYLRIKLHSIFTNSSEWQYSSLRIFTHFE